MTTTPDLSRLSDAERHILSLLAEGHTAKSIAAETGRTEGAVNERLREARRKTGVGSSRELARLLRAQENRGEKTGVAPAASAAPAAPGAPSMGRDNEKVIAMIVSFTALAAAAALALHGPDPQAMPQPPQPPVPPGGETVDSRAAEIRQAFAAERRDPAWAEGAEAALRRRYLAIAGVDAGALHVACRATFCEVSGRLRPGTGAVAGKRAVEVLASPALRRSVAGLHADVTSTASQGEGGGYSAQFNAMWRRTRG